MKYEGNDWVYLGLTAEELKNYILSEQIFWQLSPNRERFTIGNLKLAEKKLSASVLNPADKFKLERQINAFQEIRSDWKVNWNEKAKKEWLTRVNLWQQYFNDLRRNRENNVWNYASEVRNRVILQLLEGEMSEIELAHKSNLNSLDRLLRSISRESDFIWDEMYIEAFPKNEFWYLYRVFI